MFFCWQKKRQVSIVWHPTTTWLLTAKSKIKDSSMLLQTKKLQRTLPTKSHRLGWLVQEFNSSPPSRKNPWVFAQTHISLNTAPVQESPRHLAVRVLLWGVFFGDLKKNDKEKNGAKFEEHSQRLEMFFMWKKKGNFPNQEVKFSPTFELDTPKNSWGKKKSLQQMFHKKILNQCCHINLEVSTPPRKIKKRVAFHKTSPSSPTGLARLWMQRQCVDPRMSSLSKRAMRWRKDVDCFVYFVYLEVQDT